jgi:hypothetical protein
MSGVSRAGVILAALTTEPTSTSDLYARVGYANLTRVGLVPYQAFRAELAKLSAAGSVASEVGHDGATLWSLAASEDERPGPE